MKKTFYAYIVLLFVSFASLFVTSCGKNDIEPEGTENGNGTISLIVGTWYDGASEYDFKKKFTFNADGTGSILEGVDDDIPFPFYYQYEEKTGMLTIYEFLEDDVHRFFVEFTNNDEIIMYETKNGGERLLRRIR